MAMKPIRRVRVMALWGAMAVVMACPHPREVVFMTSKLDTLTRAVKQLLHIVSQPCLRIATTPWRTAPRPLPMRSAHPCPSQSPRHDPSPRPARQRHRGQGAEEDLQGLAQVAAEDGPARG